jgi:hypothetical protein
MIHWKKVACGAFSDGGFAAGRKRRDFCGLLSGSVKVGGRRH